MTEINVIVTGPEEAYDNEAEFWCGRELIGVTVLHEGRLHLRIDPRADGSPWLADVASLARSLYEAGNGSRRTESPPGPPHSRASSRDDGDVGPHTSPCVFDSDLETAAVAFRVEVFERHASGGR